ncbi:MAG: phosphoglucosamine mutase [Sphingobacteriaceae bacterium]|nr:phosphoglucosamine mutase [Sphingobacteriaceae bacterium]
MTLIKSISGIRGTIGGVPGEGLSPLDVVKFTAAFGTWLKSKNSGRTIVIGRDARISGEMVNRLVVGTLQGLGFDVVDLGLSTTPTVEVMVPELHAAGGIILTASHNPKQWNALKLLNAKGEFIDAEDGAEVLSLAESPEQLQFEDIDALGQYTQRNDAIDFHIQQILQLPLVDVEAIRARGFVVAIDCVNSTGGIAVPKLLKELGVLQVHQLYCEPNGQFPHNPEPLPEHLTEISALVKEVGADLGIVVDPDVDRLALVNEDGSMFGEEYTLVAVADYVLSQTPGNTVSNLSSTRALRDVTEKHGQRYSASAVGEVNVVAEMRRINAIIGGEGNGGIIYPGLHAGRDALLGIAFFLTHLAKWGQSMTALRASYPPYFISKNKIELTPAINVDVLLEKVKAVHAAYDINTADGVRIDFTDSWVHLRKSNTEPIIRIYAEAPSMTAADALAHRIMTLIEQLAHG